MNTLKRPVEFAGTLRVIALLLTDLVLVGFVVWGGFALGYQLPSPPWAKTLAIALWAALGLASIAAIWNLKHRWRVVVLFVAVFLALLCWWQSLYPRHDRIWADDVARLLHAEVQGQRVTFDNVRNFEWRSEKDYVARWERREYDLDQLVSADLFLSYWMGPAIAHTLVSFGFADGRHLVFSLEIRKERTESFSAIAGFFRRFESVLIAADESDIIRVRSNVRGEQVYIYSLGLSHAAMRSLFLAYVDEARELEAHPRFYNTLTSNCTTVVYKLARRIDSDLPLDYRLLLSGYLPSYLDKLGVLAKNIALDGLQQRGNITERALLSDAYSLDFSRAIRENVPTAVLEIETKSIR